jgi:hypothetical protein
MHVACNQSASFRMTSSRNIKRMVVDCNITIASGRPTPKWACNDKKHAHAPLSILLKAQVKRGGGRDGEREGFERLLLCNRFSEGP